MRFVVTDNGYHGAIVFENTDIHAASQFVIQRSRVQNFDVILHVIFDVSFEARVLREANKEMLLLKGAGIEKQIHCQSKKTGEVTEILCVTCSLEGTDIPVSTIDIQFDKEDARKKQSTMWVTPGEPARGYLLFPQHLDDIFLPKIVEVITAATQAVKKDLLEHFNNR